MVKSFKINKLTFKIIVTLMSVIGISSACFSQSTDLQNALTPTNVSKVITHARVDSFVLAENFSSLYGEIAFTGESITVITFTDTNVKQFIVPVVSDSNKAMNHLIIYYNSDKDDYIFYFVALSADGESAVVLDEEKNNIYAINTSSESNEVTITNLNAPPSCFKSCFDMKENEFEQTFSGWVVWNLGSGATWGAVFCKGCCSGWWSNGCSAASYK